MNPGQFDNCPISFRPLVWNTKMFPDIAGCIFQKSIWSHLKNYCNIVHKVVSKSPTWLMAKLCWHNVLAQMLLTSQILLKRSTILLRKHFIRTIFKYCQAVHRHYHWRGREGGNWCWDSCSWGRGSCYNYWWNSLGSTWSSCCWFYWGMVRWSTWYFILYVFIC